MTASPSNENIDAFPDAPPTWDLDWIERAVTWFRTSSHPHGPLRVATGGILERGPIRISIARGANELADHYGETITSLAPVIYQAPATGTAWSRPTEEDPRSGHRRRVATFTPLNDALGNDLEIRLKVNGRVIAPRPAVGEATGTRATNEYRFTALEVGEPRLWLVVYGVDLTRTGRSKGTRR